MSTSAENSRDHVKDSLPLFDLQEKLNDLEELIARSTFDLPFVLEVGDLCAAFDSSTTNEGDIPWYRVRVVRLLDDEVSHGVMEGNPALQKTLHWLKKARFIFELNNFK